MELEDGKPGPLPVLEQVPDLDRVFLHYDPALRRRVAVHLWTGERHILPEGEWDMDEVDGFATFINCGGDIDPNSEESAMYAGDVLQKSIMLRRCRGEETEVMVEQLAGDNERVQGWSEVRNVFFEEVLVSKSATLLPRWFIKVVGLPFPALGRFGGCGLLTFTRT